MFKVFLVKFLVEKSRGGQVGRALSSGPEDPRSRLAWRNSIMYTNGAYKIRPGYNVPQVPIQIIPREYQSG